MWWVGCYGGGVVGGVDSAVLGVVGGGGLVRVLGGGGRGVKF